MRISFVIALFLFSITTFSQSFDTVSSFVREGKYKEAQELLSDMPQTGQVLYWRGYVSYSSRHLNQAMVYYFEAIPKLEGDWRHRAIIGVSEIIRKNNLPKEALEQIRLAVKEQKEGYDLYSMYYNLALINRDLGRYGEAIANAVTAKDMAPNTAEEHNCLNMIAIILKRDGSYAKALEFLEEIPSNSKHYAKALHNMGLNHLHLGDTVQAISMLKNSLELKEGRKRFMTLLDLGRLTSDLALLTEAITHIPNNPDPDEYEVFYEASRIENDPKYFNHYMKENTAFIERMLEAQKLYRKYAALNTLAMIKQAQKLKAEQAANWWKWPVGVLFLLLLGYVIWRYLKKRRFTSEIDSFERENGLLK